MRCRFGVGERPVGKAQRLVGSAEHPQYKGVVNLRCGARILTEPVGEIAMACRVVELDGPLKMAMSAGEVAEIEAGEAGNAVRNHSLRAIRPAVASRRKSSAISRIGPGSPRVRCPDQRP